MKTAWLLSPYTRLSSGRSYETIIGSNGGYTSYYVISGDKGDIRPAISLIPGTYITSGSGTATDPWLIDE